MEMQQTDSDAISKLLEEYFNGTFAGDVNKLNELYNSTTLLFGDVKGQPYAKTVAQYLEGVKTRQSPRASGRPFKGDIQSIRVFNSIAVAELNVKMYEFNYHVFLSLHRINGRWLIVHKMLTDTNS